jgi:ABC-type multidrug transport system permease subunit
VFVLIIAASTLFSLLGLLAGMLTNKTQMLTLFSSVVVVPMTFLCGTVFDSSVLPDAVAFIIYCLPLTHVSAVMRGLMLPDYSVGIDSIIILAIYIAVLYAICYYMIKNNKC